MKEFRYMGKTLKILPEGELRSGAQLVKALRDKGQKPLILQQFLVSAHALIVAVNPKTGKVCGNGSKLLFPWDITRGKDREAVVGWALEVSGFQIDKKGKIKKVGQAVDLETAASRDWREFLPVAGAPAKAPEAAEAEAAAAEAAEAEAAAPEAAAAEAAEAPTMEQLASELFRLPAAELFQLSELILAELAVRTASAAAPLAIAA